jgi:hypothetical protein
LGKRTGRPRGAPRGNRNRWVHGRYSAAAQARRAETRALLAGCKRAIETAMILHRCGLSGNPAARWPARKPARHPRRRFYPVWRRHGLKLSFKYEKNIKWPTFPALLRAGLNNDTS